MASRKAAPAVPKSEDKRRRIVAAATLFFSRYGFKKTTIDALAAEADVAKPTVYAYFEDKEAIFRAVVESVCEQTLAAASEASRRSAPLEERLAAMLSAKFTSYWELVHSSAHAAELMSSHGRIGAEIIQRTDHEYARLLAAVLAQARELDLAAAGLAPPAAAALFIRAASGANYDATSAANHRKHLAEIVRLIVTGLRRTPESA